MSLCSCKLHCDMHGTIFPLNSHISAQTFSVRQMSSFINFEAKHDDEHEQESSEEESSSSDNIHSDSFPHAKRCRVGYGVHQVSCGSAEVMEELWVMKQMLKELVEIEY